MTQASDSEAETEGEAEADEAEAPEAEAAEAEAAEAADDAFFEPFLKEWIQLKEVVLAEHYPRDNMYNLWNLIGQYHGDDFPNMMKLGHLAISSPVHTADCERGFSAQNRILTPLRNRLTPENQDLLIRVMLHAKKEPEADSEILERAFEDWENWNIK